MAFPDWRLSIIRLFRTSVPAGQLAQREGPNYKVPFFVSKWHEHSLGNWPTSLVSLIHTRLVLCLKKTSGFKCRMLWTSWEEKNFANRAQMLNWWKNWQTCSNQKIMMCSEMQACNEGFDMDNLEVVQICKNIFVKVVSWVVIIGLLFG